MKKILIFLNLFLMTLFSSSCEYSKCDRLNNKLIKKYLKIMKDKGLYVAGIGGGVKEGKIRSNDIAFDIEGELNLENARILIVYAVEKLLFIINHSEYGYCYVNFPVTPDDIDVSICTIETGPVEKNSVEIVSASRNEITYYTKSDNEKDYLYMKLHEETFEEAQKIVREQNARKN